MDTDVSKPDIGWDGEFRGVTAPVHGNVEVVTKQTLVTEARVERLENLLRDIDRKLFDARMPPEHPLVASYWHETITEALKPATVYGATEVAKIYDMEAAHDAYHENWDKRLTGVFTCYDHEMFCRGYKAGKESQNER